MLTITQSQLQTILDDALSNLMMEAARVPVFGTVIVQELTVIKTQMDNAFDGVYSNLTQLEILTIDAVLNAVALAVPSTAAVIGVIIPILNAILAGQVTKVNAKLAVAVHVAAQQAA